jgi:hypothetical protein
LTDIHPPTPSLLTKTGLEWLMGKKKVSKFMNIRLEVTLKRNFRFSKPQNYRYLFKMVFLMS